NDDAIRSAALLTRVVASAVAEGVQARAGQAAGDAKPEAGAGEPLAEWETELLTQATAGADAAAPEAAAGDAPAAE
ncbi:30S ribosomal protein S2, partial [Gordonia effusa NBRC 100432]